MVERILFSPGGATEAKQDLAKTVLDALLTELEQKYEGGPIALDAATLSALENIVVSGTIDLSATTLAALEQITATVANWPADYPDAVTQNLLAAIEAAVEGTLDVTGVVGLDVATLAALESINAAATVTNWPAVFPDQHDQPLTDDQLRATPVPVSVPDPLSVDDNGGSLTTDGSQDYRYSGGKSAVTETLFNLGEVTLVTPQAGNRVVLYWIVAITDPQASVNPIITVKLGGVEVYRGYALSHWERFVGPVDGPLVVGLSSGGSNVAVTAHYTEGP